MSEGTAVETQVACGKCGASRDARSNCTPCSTITSRRWTQANPDRARAAQRAYIERNPERVRRARYNSKLKAQYGITIEDYDRMLASQGGHCAICPVTENGRQGRMFFCVDHDHKTGVVRGLLCANCNDGLGRFRDNPDFLASAIAYLLTGDDS